MRVEVFTVAWMLIEAVIAIGAGIAARSVLLTAFGLDSAIELLSGVTLLWRLAAESRSSDLGRVEAAERLATWVSAVLLSLLCVYLLSTSIAGLVVRLEPGESWLGLGISAAAVVVMPLLASRKRAVNRSIQSSALRADIVETITCAYMAGATLAGMALSAFTGWWWAEYIAGFTLLFFVARETWEAIEAALEGRNRCKDE